MATLELFSLGARRATWTGKAALVGALLVALATLTVLALGGCEAHHGSSPASPVEIPDTPAGDQARWLFAVAAKPPIPAEEIRAHFAPRFLAQVSPEALNALFARVRGFRIVAVASPSPNRLTGTLLVNGTDRLAFSLNVDAKALIEGLAFRPAVPPPPTSWSRVEEEIRSAAPVVHMLVAELFPGGFRPIRAIDAETPAPLASSFKLYVLDALARAIADGQVSWSEELTVTAQVRSIPTGELQDAPDGTKVSVRDAALKMISISDNTAADLLIDLLGRSAIEASLRSSGMARPSLDAPFLTTRELSTLKLYRWPILAHRYLGLSQEKRVAFLTNHVDSIPRSRWFTPAALRAWRGPRSIDRLEWFASPADMCRLFASLADYARRPTLSEIGSILGANRGGLELDSRRWTRVWFKGGAEPGVLTLNFLATNRNGHTYVVSVLAENRFMAIPAERAIPRLLSAIEGAFLLAAQDTTAQEAGAR